MTTMTASNEAKIPTYQEKRHQLQQVVTFAPTGRPFLAEGEMTLWFFYRCLRPNKSREWPAGGVTHAVKVWFFWL